MFHEGTPISLTGSIFTANAAGEGPAVMSDGSINNLSGVTFNDNTFYCPEGEYGYDKQSEAEEVIQRHGNTYPRCYACYLHVSHFSTRQVYATYRWDHI